MSQSNQFDLLKQRRFGPFFGVQFLGAFNDNVYKNALVILLTFQAASVSTMSPGLLVNLCAGLFILPFFLFSATAGQLADKYEKAMLTRWVKIFEIVIMIVGASLPYTPLAPYLGFVPLPWQFWPILGVTLVCYLLLTQLIKHWMVKKNWI